MTRPVETDTAVGWVPDQVTGHAATMQGWEGAKPSPPLSLFFKGRGWAEFPAVGRVWGPGPGPDHVSTRLLPGWETCLDIQQVLLDAQQHSDFCVPKALPVKDLPLEEQT